MASATVPLSTSLEGPSEGTTASGLA